MSLFTTIPTITTSTTIDASAALKAASLHLAPSTLATSGSTSSLSDDEGLSSRASSQTSGDRSDSDSYESIFEQALFGATAAGTGALPSDNDDTFGTMLDADAVRSQVCKLVSAFPTTTAFSLCLDPDTGATKPCCVAAGAFLKGAVMASSARNGIAGVLDVLQTKFKWAPHGAGLSASVSSRLRSTAAQA